MSKYELAGIPEQPFTTEELQEIKTYREQTGISIYDTMIEMKYGVKFFEWR